MSPRETETAEGQTAGRLDSRLLALALGIGAAVGVGIAVTWLPRRRRRRRRLVPAPLARRYRRPRRMSSQMVDDIRATGRELADEFREELGASLEAAREQFGDMAREQYDQLRRAVRRERSKTRS